MSERENQLRLDLFALRYLEAVEAGDLDAVERLWAEADVDLELEHLLHGLNGALAADKEDQVQAEAAVTAAVEQHMPSARIMRSVFGPLTVADVFEEIRRTPPPGLTADDIKLIDSLRGRQEVVPEQLGLRQVIAWGSQFGHAPEGFWKAFRETALRLRMQRASEPNFQMAARPAPPKPPRGSS